MHLCLMGFQSILYKLVGQPHHLTYLLSFTFLMVQLGLAGIPLSLGLVVEDKPTYFHVWGANFLH